MVYAEITESFGIVDASIGAEDGLLPLGERPWGCKDSSGQYPERVVTLSVGEEEAPAEANDKEIDPLEKKNWGLRRRMASIRKDL